MYKLLGKIEVTGGPGADCRKFSKKIFGGSAFAEQQKKIVCPVKGKLSFFVIGALALTFGKWRKLTQKQKLLRKFC